MCDAILINDSILMCVYMILSKINPRKLKINNLLAAALTISVVYLGRFRYKYAIPKQTRCKRNRETILVRTAQISVQRSYGRTIFELASKCICIRGVRLQKEHRWPGEVKVPQDDI